MLTQSTVDRILSLLAEDQLSQRQIATQLGVSHGTVCNLANGLRGSHGKQPPCFRPALPPVGRCRQCGAKVYLPCVACQARDFRRRQLEARRQAGMAYGERSPVEPLAAGVFASPRVA